MIIRPKLPGAHTLDWEVEDTAFFPALMLTGGMTVTHVILSKTWLVKDDLGLKMAA